MIVSVLACLIQYVCPCFLLFFSGGQQRQLHIIMEHRRGEYRTNSIRARSRISSCPTFLCHRERQPRPCWCSTWRAPFWAPYTPARTGEMMILGTNKVVVLDTLRQATAKCFHNVGRHMLYSYYGYARVPVDDHEPSASGYDGVTSISGCRVLFLRGG